jgi:Subunit 11 of the general transcription factor TFIIH
LLNIAGSVNTYLPAFPPSPKLTFGLLRKLDHAFSSLLRGEDSTTGEILPGFERGIRGGMSKTDMVRCKGLVEATRVLVVDVMNKEPELDENMEMDDAETDLEDDPTMDIEEQKFEMDVARVYEQTIVQLGERLDGNGGFGVVN